uniref:Helicase domino n=1 Tax=Macrostomum lignano TaxID=282301 RepID=A0A1I8HXF3_9PLAT
SFVGAQFGAMSAAPPPSSGSGGAKPKRSSIGAAASPAPVDAKRARLAAPVAPSLVELRRAYHDHVAELSYLQAGNNLLDYLLWRQSCPKSLLAALKAEALDEDDRRWIGEMEKSGRPATVPQECEQAATTGNPIVNYLQLPRRSSPPSQQQRQLRRTSSQQSSQASPQPSLASQTSSSPTKQEKEAEIVDQAKHEAQVMQKVAELKAAGLWSSKRLPKCLEPPRPKSHWDYLLEEMQWLATDFMQERKFRRVFSRKMCLMVQRHFREKEDRERRQEKEEFHNLKRIASQCARMVREWWLGIQKFVEFKHSNRLEEKRRKALDLHLNFIVDQTEKYSEWLVEGLNAGGASSSGGAGSVAGRDDEEFVPAASDLDADMDDEETIAKAEAEDLANTQDGDDEIAALQRDMDQPMEELLRSLPPEILEKPASLPGSEAGTDDDKDKGDTGDEDSEFRMDSDDAEAEDVEDTIAEEEAAVGGSGDAGVEVDELAEEAELPLEELLKRYRGAFEGGHSEADEAASVAEKSGGEDGTASGKSGDASDNTDNEGDEASAGAKSAIAELAEMDATSDTGDANGEDVEARRRCREKLDEGYRELAAEALSALPKGFTLNSTKISVPIPHLLRGGSLREYQIVGLDWLATLYDKRLNGILADEMGLGKTIQTIALLAHLACDRGVWGPHLIVVPTSVMLNWEMEFKKWCPGFKILTYFGSLKERKEKRKGWTKTNAFHVCITSYKLAIQDSRCFKLKKWKYLILDEAQNIKNFKSQRWQTLLTFNKAPSINWNAVANSLMELWSLMHFLMPQVFQSHREFREWFANPLTGMVEGTQEYSDQLVRRLHKVLRPFLLRRLKKDVEKQMPKKYEHVVMCRLSKRQRYLYDDFMSRASTKETLASGHFMSVINVLMQLRKVCNHPNLFEERPTVSPLRVDPIRIDMPGDVLRLRDYDPMRQVLLETLWPNMCEMERDLPSFVASRVEQLRPKRPLIQELADAAAQDAAIGSSDGSFPDSVFNFRGLPVSRKPFISRATLKESKLELAKTAALPPEAPVDPDAQLPDGIRQIRQQARHDRVSLLDRLSDRRCQFQPVYGCDLLAAVSIFRHPTEPHSVLPSWRRGCLWTSSTQRTQPRAQSYCLMRGHLHCLKLRKSDPRLLFASTSGLECLVNRPEDRLVELRDVIDRFCFAVPPVLAGEPFLSCPWQQRQDAVERESAIRSQSSRCDLLHPIASRQAVQFPDGRLIQYDCGKLQSLDLLLKRLKPKGHRVLIFTQMARMLDILEQFLSHHGHIYLRLDGTTRVEQRQILMERFNADSRIFVFILSTRSGGLGVNLTGADTVVFYDSTGTPPWMRRLRIAAIASARLGMLISEKTVEENILKKANQKRWLNDVAIEGGNFTAAFFQQNTIKELFSEPTGLDDLVAKKKTRLAAAAEKEQQAEAESRPGIETALEEVEDESDRQAAEKAKKETVEELAEFDEDIPWDENEALLRQREHRLERRLAALESELSSLERYGLSFIESHQELMMNWELEQAEVNIEQSKREWELQQLKQLRQEEELRAELEEDDMFMCYGAYDPARQVRELARQMEIEDADHDLRVGGEEAAVSNASPDRGRTADRLVSSLGIRQVQLADDSTGAGVGADANSTLAARRRAKKIKRQRRVAAETAAQQNQLASPLQQEQQRQQLFTEESLVIVDNETSESGPPVQLPTLLMRQQKRKADPTERSFRLFPPAAAPPMTHAPPTISQPLHSSHTTATPASSAGVTLLQPQSSARPVTLVTRQIVIPNGQVIHQQFIQPRYLQQQSHQGQAIRLVPVSQSPSQTQNLVLMPQSKQQQPQQQLITLHRSVPQQTVRLVPAAPSSAAASPGSLGFQNPR